MTAIEFAFVATPFVLLMFGIMSVCLFYFANFSIENAVWQAARAIRTGQVQQSQGAYAGAVTNADRKIAFKKALCDRAPTFLDCQSKAVVIVQSNANFSGISEPSCATDGTMITDAAAPFDPGAGSAVVLVTVCYAWEVRRQAAVLQDGQPERWLAAHAGVRRLPLGALQLTLPQDSKPVGTIPTIETTMSPPPIGDLIVRAGNLLQRWKDDAKGAAAVEFAMIVPIMAIMFIGAVELSQAITVDRRVSQVASSTADLVARWSPPSGSGSTMGIPQSEITDITRVGGIIVSPYDRIPLQIIIRSVMSSPTDATNTKQWWSCTFDGLGSTLACACSNTSYTLPPNLVTTLDNVVISEATYSYKPLVFDHFMKKLGTSGTPGTYTLAETIYLKPRNGQVNMQQPDNTPCPTPTF